jgi:predicted transcriptional regulator
LNHDKEVVILTSAPPEATWRFLTNHGNALLYIALNPDARARDIAEHVGITERAAQRIVADLIAEGYLERTKIGRRNRYTIIRNGHLRHPAFTDVEIGALIDVFHSVDGAQPPLPSHEPDDLRRRSHRNGDIPAHGQELAPR